MIARNLIAAGVLVAVVAACSKPAAEAARQADPDFESELELALFGANAGPSGVVVSELELTNASPEPAPRPVAGRTAPRVEGIAPVALLGEPVLSTPAPEEPALALAPVTPVSVPAAGSSAGDRAGESRGRGTWSGPVIIRGGVSGRDPCVIHLPGRGGVIIAGGTMDPRGTMDPLGAIGVLINDRVPRSGDIYRAPGGGRGGSISMGGRGSFPGGIR